MIRHRRALPEFLSALAGAVIIILGAWGIDHLLWSRSIQQMSAMSLENLRRDAFILEASIRSRVNDLSLLKAIAESSLKPDSRMTRALETVEPAAKNLMMTRDVYEQIRLLSLDGKELYRLNYDIVTRKFAETPKGDLQDKSSRSYVRETIEGPVNFAVSSPFDLNVENGRIETPYRPVLRMSTPLLDSSGRASMLLVLNINGQKLLRNLAQFAEGRSRLLLLNGDGYWLAGETPDASWAFMFPERQNERLPVADPDLWTKLKSADQGTFIRKGIVYSFQWVDPISSPLEYPPLAMPLAHGDRLRWCMVKTASVAQIAESWRGTRHILWLSTALLLATAVPGLWIGVRNLRERNRARQELHHVLETSAHGLTVLAAVRDSSEQIRNFRLLSYNAAAEKISRLPLSEMTGKTLVEDTPDGANHGLFAFFRQVTESGEEAQIEDLQMHNGTPHWLLINAARLDDGVVVNFADITEIKNAQESVNRGERLLTLAARLAKAGAWQIDYPSESITWSEETYTIHEVGSDYHPVMESALEFYAPASREKLIEAYGRCLDEGVPFDLELELITGTGRHLWVRDIAEARYDEYGNIQAIFGIIQDITPARQALLDAQELSHAAMAAEQAKAQFLAVMSHEIRTPMNGILGFADILSQRPLSPEDKDAVATIRESGRSLLRILNDILDFSSIESGRFCVEFSPFSPAEIVKSTQGLLASLVQKKPLSLRTEIAPDVPPWVLGDGGRVRQVVMNLAGNALKFTEKGSITIGVRKVSPDPADSRLEFFCEDTGAGIAPEKLVTIFDPFIQADNSIARRYGGTGLGLAISRSLVELMGGVMSVESTVGMGSTFDFILPLPATDPDIPEAIVLPSTALDRNFASAHPLRILAADDDAINLKLLALMLRKLGYEPITINKSRDVVSTLVTGNYDCAIIDIHMPEVDGLTIASQMRELEASGQRSSRLYLIAFSANVLPEDRAEAYLAGVDDYLTKPLGQSALAEALRMASICRPLPTAPTA